MGVAGSGKTTVGKLLAQKLSIPFLDADDFHSAENKKAMRSGRPLTDEDRLPWLILLSEALQENERANGAVLACSALKESYRKILQQCLQQKIIWLYLEGAEEIILERIRKRTDHFMPAELLSSQFAIIEKPADAFVFSIEKSPEKIVDDIITLLEKIS